MIKIKVERTHFLNGIGFYVSKKSYNFYDDNKWWYGPSIAMHFSKRIIRLSWRTNPNA